MVDGELFLREVIRVRQEAPELGHLIEQVHRRTNADITLIEDADLGRGIAQNLRRTSRLCRPQLYQPRLDKIARMQARAVMFETGKVFLPRNAPWLAQYLEELLGFPNQRHDDQVDSTSQALDWFQHRFAREIAGPRPSPARPKGRRRPPGAPQR
jgi:predicted phage terminase large subunit-like protein